MAGCFAGYGCNPVTKGVGSVRAVPRWIDVMGRLAPWFAQGCGVVKAPGTLGGWPGVTAGQQGRGGAAGSGGCGCLMRRMQAKAQW